MTRRNLELVEPLRAGARGATLLETIDRTVTPMGARLLRQWLLSPLRDPAAIEARLDAVEVLVARRPRPGPAPRGAGRRARPRATGRARRRRPRHAAGAGCAPRFVPPAARRARGARRASRTASGSTALGQLVEELRPPRRPRRRARPARSRSGRPPTLADGGVIRAGYDAELDELRDLRDGGKQYIASLQQRERERTGITSLKVGYNKVFGYYLEVTNAHAAEGARRLRAAADADRRRALRHPGAQGLRGAGSWAPRSGWRRARRSSSARCATAVGRRDRPGAAHRPRRWPASTSGPRSPRSRGARIATCGPTVHDGFDLALAAEPPSGHRAADAARVVHPQRRALHRGRAGAARHRAQHGRQDHHPAADRPLRGAGADGRASCPRRGRRVGRGGPALHPRRRERQPRAGPVHLHGGDERDQRDPPQRRPRGAWCCSTRSAAAPRPTTAWRSPGRSASTCTTGSGARRCSPPTTTS